LRRQNEKIDELCKQFEDYPNQLIDKMKVIYEKLRKIKRVTSVKNIDVINMRAINGM